jgi:hypothetical protein
LQFVAFFVVTLVAWWRLSVFRRDICLNLQGAQLSCIWSPSVRTKFSESPAPQFSSIITLPACGLIVSAEIRREWRQVMKVTRYGRSRPFVPSSSVLIAKSWEELHVASHQVDCDIQWTEERVATKSDLCVVCTKCTEWTHNAEVLHASPFLSTIHLHDRLILNKPWYGDYIAPYPTGAGGSLFGSKTAGSWI